MKFCILSALFFLFWNSTSIAAEQVKVPTIEAELDSSPACGDTIVNFYQAAPVTFNPLLARESISQSFCSLIYSSLTSYNQNCELEPDLASSWEISADGLQITFELKSGIKWHDGVDFTAEDVRFTYDLIMNPVGRPADQKMTGCFETLEVLTSHSLRFKLKKPFAPALNYCGFQIIARHIYLTEDLNTSSFNLNPIGTGPFRFVRYLKNEQVVLAANQEYFSGRPFVDRLITRIIPDRSQAFLMFKRGEIDVFPLTWDQYVNQVKGGELESKINVYTSTNKANFLLYNNSREILSDRRVRRALTQAIDREALVREVLHGYGTNTSGPCLPDSWAYDKTIEPWPYSTREATNLLSAAGWSDTDGDGTLERGTKELRLSIVRFGNDPVAMLVPGMVMNYWSTVGATTELSVTTWGGLMDKAGQGDFDVIMIGNRIDPTEPDSNYSVWHSCEIPDPKLKKGDNLARYSNPEVDSLLERGREIFDKAERQKIYHALHRLLHEDQPCTFLGMQQSFFAVNKRFHGISATMAGGLTPMWRWFVPESQQKYSDGN
ncbi:MAG: ABC transporter substrate-binding protein [Candidatus Wallbacteria bacterium]|nr:ABC transporter substrate-binding protein [Candidatus Wallbacteria bacterium]